MLKRNVSRFGVIEATMKVTAYNSFYDGRGRHKSSTITLKGVVSGKDMEIEALLMGNDAKAVKTLQDISNALHYDGSRVEGRDQIIHMFLNVTLFNVAKPFWGSRWRATIIEAGLNESSKMVVLSLGSNQPAF